MTNLTEGACLLHTPTPDFPVVQVLSIQKLPNSHLQRHRLVVSDGMHFRSALLAIHLNQLIQSQEISALCLIQLKDFVLTTDQAEGTEQATSLLLFLLFSHIFILFYFYFAELFLLQMLLLSKTDKKSLAIHDGYLLLRTTLRKQNVLNANQQQTPQELDVDIIFVVSAFQSKDASFVACWPALMMLKHWFCNLKRRCKQEQ